MTLQSTRRHNLQSLQFGFRRAPGQWHIWAAVSVTRPDAGVLTTSYVSISYKLPRAIVTAITPNDGVHLSSITCCPPNSHRRNEFATKANVSAPEKCSVPNIFQLYGSQA